LIELHWQNVGDVGEFIDSLYSSSLTVEVTKVGQLLCSLWNASIV